MFGRCRSGLPSRLSSLIVTVSRLFGQCQMRRCLPSWKHLIPVPSGLSSSRYAGWSYKCIAAWQQHTNSAWVVNAACRFAIDCTTQLLVRGAKTHCSNQLWPSWSDFSMSTPLSKGLTARSCLSMVICPPHLLQYLLHPNSICTGCLSFHVQVTCPSDLLCLISPVTQRRFSYASI